MKKTLDTKVINNVRALSIDMINKANSGHPGMPLGAAPIGHTIYKEMKINPSKPNWFNRDRFVLASGHASALLYSLLHLNGFDVKMDDLKEFRQWQSKTPGHPEFGHTAGVDATSGPLGQGIGMGLGMAIAEAYLAATYNKEDYNIIDHYTYVLTSDGDLQEGVAFEACAIAGNLKMGKLICFYDSNDITLDGPIAMSTSDCIKARFESMNWQYILVEDGNDLDALERALAMAKLEVNKPTMIEVKTIIGYGAPKQGTSKTHGSPLGKEDGDITKKFLGVSLDEFSVDQEVYDEYTAKKVSEGEKAYRKWNSLFKDYMVRYPDLAEELEAIIANKYTVDFSKFDKKKAGESQATRNSSHDMINFIASQYPTFFGGSADLSASNMTTIKDSDTFGPKNYGGKNINFGVREFAMATINNGATLHGGVKLFGATFFVFSDYLKPAIKMAALMEIPTIYVLTHDSIAVGEDGPTHEPIEQLAMLRSMPNVNVIRPADATETIAAWQVAIESKKTPTCIVLSRQNLKVEEKTCNIEALKGAYVVHPEEKEIDALIIATGSEVNLAVDAAKALKKDKIDVRVVSMPSRNIFEAQSKKYQKEIIPGNIRKRLVIEMASPFGWHKYGLKDEQILGIDMYGASAPTAIVLENYGFSVDNVVEKIKSIVK